MLKIKFLNNYIKLNRPFSFPILFSFSNDSKKINEEISSSFTKSKFKANQDLVENVFFPDYEQISKDHELRAIIKQKQRRKENQDENKNNFLLNSEEMKKINGHSANITHHPKNVEELIELIKSTELNDKLLKTYVKNMRFFGRKEKKLLLRKIFENLNKDKEIREKFQEIDKEKLAKLKKINQNIEFHSNRVFLNKTGVLKHYGFKLLLQTTLSHIREKYKPVDIILATKSFFDFYRHCECECDQELVGLFIEKIKEKFDTLDAFCLCLVLEICSHYKQINLNYNIAKNMIIKACKLLEKFEFKDLELFSLLSINKALGNACGIMKFAEIAYKIEPHILKNLKFLNLERITLILCSHLDSHTGSIEYKKILAALISTKSDELKEKEVRILFIKLNQRNHRFELLKEMEFRILNEKLTKSLMNSVMQSKCQIRTIETILNINYGYIETLLTEFIKLIAKVEFSEQIEEISKCAMEIGFFNFSSKNLREILGYKMKVYYQKKAQSQLIAGILLGRQDESNSHDLFPKTKIYEPFHHSQKDQKYENDIRCILLQKVNLLWTYLKITYEQNLEKEIDFEMITLVINFINEDLEQLKKFPGLISFFKHSLEMMLQINEAISLLPFNLIPQQIKSFDHLEHKIKKNKFPSINDDSVEDIIERRMFLNKYFKNLSFNTNVSGFFNFVKLKTPMEKHPLIFLNERNSHFTDSESGKRIENGLIKFRKMLLKKGNRKSLTINDKDIINSSYKLNGSEQLSLEELLSETIKLPPVELDDYVNLENFKKDLRILKNIRSQGNLSHVTEMERRRILEVEKQEEEEDIGEFEDNTKEEDSDLKSFFTKLGKK